MKAVYLSLGGNLGKVEQSFEKARAILERKIGQIKDLSSLYKTAAWGKTDQDDFLNQVILLESKLSSEEILEACLSTEKTLGRERFEKWVPRTIDIDLLFHDEEIVHQEKLIIPHPHVHERKFILVPLTEIASSFIHPQLNLTMEALLQKVTDSLEVVKIPS